MDEDDFQPQPAPPAQPLKREYSEALLQSAIESLRARGDSTRRMACMSLPTPIFNDLCARLLERSTSVRETAEWLAGQVEDAPARSSVERFSDALFEEYRSALLSARRAEVVNYLAKETGGDPDAMAMAAQRRFSEMFTDLLLKKETFEGVGADELFSITSAMKAIAQVAFGKQTKDARLRESEAKLRKAQADLEAKEMRLQAERDARQRALDAATKAAEAGGGGAAVVAAIKQAMGITGEAA
jgi:hypothetical protein